MHTHNNNIKTHKNSKIVKGEALSAPHRRKGSREKKSTLEVVPPLFPSLQRHSPFDSDMRVCVCEL